MVTTKRSIQEENTNSNDSKDNSNSMESITKQNKKKENRVLRKNPPREKRVTFSEDIITNNNNKSTSTSATTTASSSSARENNNKRKSSVSSSSTLSSNRSVANTRSCTKRQKKGRTSSTTIATSSDVDSSSEEESDTSSSQDTSYSPKKKKKKKNVRAVRVSTRRKKASNAVNNKKRTSKSTTNATSTTDNNNYGTGYPIKMDLHKMTPRQRMQNWQTLFDMSRSSLLPDDSTCSTDHTEGEVEEDDDGFDCSDILNSDYNQTKNSKLLHRKIEQELMKGIQKWNDLDARKVITNTNNNKKNSRSNRHSSTAIVGGGGGVKLPYRFDYKSELTQEQLHDRIEAESSNNNKTRERVISLVNPNEYQDYEEELWKIFHNVPTLEQFVSSNDVLKHDQDNKKSRKKLPSSQLQAQAQAQAEPRHLKALRQEVEKTFKLTSRSDCHSLSRLRMRNHHHLPVFYSKNNTMPSSRNTTGDIDTDTNAMNSTSATRASGAAPRNSSSSRTSSLPLSQQQQGLKCVIRIECWRRGLKRGTSISPEKLELEMLGDHTLLDLHNFIVKQAHDPLESLFVPQVQEEKKQGDKQQENNNNGMSTNNEQEKEKGATTEVTKTTSTNGMFYIEDIFYTSSKYAQDMYVKPITDWLNGEKEGLLHYDYNYTSYFPLHMEHPTEEMIQENTTKTNRRAFKKKKKKNQAEKSIQFHRAFREYARHESLAIPYYTNNDSNDGDSRNSHVVNTKKTESNKNNSQKTMKMDSTQLNDVPFRLGVRYTHIFHGDLEYSLFFTDVRLMGVETTPSSPLSFLFPRVIDPWNSSALASNSQNKITCDACLSCSSDVIVSHCGRCCGYPNEVINSENTNNEGGSSTSSSNKSMYIKMCANCFYEFHYDTSSGKLLSCYNIMGHDDDNNTDTHNSESTHSDSRKDSEGKETETVQTMTEETPSEEKFNIKVYPIELYQNEELSTFRDQFLFNCYV